MKLVRHSDPSAFQRQVLPFLLRNEALHCVGIGIVDTLVREPAQYPAFHLWTVEDGGAIVGVAWLTPPYPLGLSLMPEAAIALLADEARSLPFPLPAVAGPAPVADAFHGELLQRGGTLEAKVSMRLYQATSAVLPRGVPGSMRAATARDLDRLVRWQTAFCEECHLRNEAAHARQDTECAIRNGGGYIWEDAGEPVAMTGVSGHTPNGIRVNYVYTPGDKRGKGYASALVAAVTARQLASGKKLCYLFTDLANPTSNAIYQKVGYAPLSEYAMYHYATGS